MASHIFSESWNKSFCTNVLTNHPQRWRWRRRTFVFAVINVHRTIFPIHYALDVERSIYFKDFYTASYGWISYKLWSVDWRSFNWMRRVMHSKVLTYRWDLPFLAVRTLLSSFCQIVSVKLCCGERDEKRTSWRPSWRRSAAIMVDFMSEAYILFTAVTTVDTSNPESRSAYKKKPNLIQW